MGDTPDLTGLPGWAQVIGYGLFAASLAVIGVMTRFGFRMGQTTPPTGPASAEVAAVIVDPEALNKATAAVLRLEGTMDRLTDLVGQHVADLREEREEQAIEEEVDRRVTEQLSKRRRPAARTARPKV